MKYYFRKLTKNDRLNHFNLLKQDGRNMFYKLKCFPEIHVETLYATRTKSEIKTQIGIVF
jgi:hypothetical protein